MTLDNESSAATMYMSNVILANNTSFNTIASWQKIEETKLFANVEGRKKNLYTVD